MEKVTLDFKTWLFNSQRQEPQAKTERVVPLYFEKFHSYMKGYLAAPMLQLPDGTLMIARSIKTDLLTDLEIFFKCLSDSFDVYLLKAASITSKSGSISYVAYYMTFDKGFSLKSE
jgi:hypothetical protein